MRNIPKTIGWPMIFGAALLIGVIVAPSFALRNAAPPRPPVICHVDLQQVFNASQWRADAKIEIANLTAAVENEIGAQRNTVEELRADLDLFPPNSPQYKAKTAELIDALARLQALIDFHEAKHDVRRAALRSEIYERIVTAAKVFAQANGIDYIITDDSKVQMEPVAEVQVVQQMALQRIVYTDPAYDITIDLINWINGKP